MRALHEITQGHYRRSSRNPRAPRESDVPPAISSKKPPTRDLCRLALLAFLTTLIFASRSGCGRGRWPQHFDRNNQGIGRLVGVDAPVEDMNGAVVGSAREEGLGAVETHLYRGGGREVRGARRERGKGEGASWISEHRPRGVTTTASAAARSH